MIGLNKYKKTISLLISLSILFLLSGCDMLKSSISERKANRYVEEFIESANLNLLRSLEKYSSEEIDTIDLLELQEELYTNYSNCTLEIDEVSLVNENEYDKANCKLKVKYRDIEDIVDGKNSATYEEYEEYISELRATSHIVKLKLVNVDGQWQFEDLNELYDRIYVPYSKLIFVDKIGIALNPDIEYYKERCVACIWYDPYMSAPLDGDKVESPVALQCAFYFDRPITQNFEARLIDSKGKTISRREIKMDSSVISICDFSLEYLDISSFQTDSYKIELYYDDELIGATDTPINVI